jgi:hypothetical protein
LWCLLLNKEEMREKVHILFYIVLHLKEWLPILDGKLCSLCTRPEHADKHSEDS